MEQPVVIIGAYKFHGSNDVPLMKSEEETKEYREQNEHEYKQQVR